MKKAIIGGALAIVLGAGLAGCAPGNNTPGSTAVGAVVGGIAGGALFGTTGGAIAGALVGGSVGYIVGRDMDRQDRINMENAIINTPTGQEATWTNGNSHVTYVVVPQANYTYRSWHCRRYKTRIKIKGTWRTAYGRACKTPNGWRIVS